MVEQNMINNTLLKLVVGDITKQNTEAIVNAANSSLLGGGGVDGAIHRAGGPQILKECQEIRREQGKCAPGKAVITSGGKLKANYVIHTVGPVWQGGGHDEPAILADAYRNSLKLAVKQDLKSISFPSISTGAYRFPVDRAAHIALQTIKNFCEEENGLEEIRVVLFTRHDYQIYLNAWQVISE